MQVLLTWFMINIVNNIYWSASCDAGYGNLDCVPIDTLPRRLTSHFDGDSNLIKIFGGGISSGCGVLMGGLAALFHKVSHITHCFLQFYYPYLVNYGNSNDFFLYRTVYGTLSQ